MPRIFIGIKMSEKIEKLVDDWAKDKKDWPVRLVKPRNLHLTLVPPFYEDNIEKIASQLEKIEPIKTPASILFHTISHGPRPPDYRLVWATGEESPELEKLKAKIEKSLNLRPERRKFLPHLTLARFRPEAYHNFKVKNLNESINWDEEVRNFVIFEAILRPEGAEYKILRSF